MIAEPQSPKVYHFPGLRVTVPEQPIPVSVIDKPLPPLSSMPGSDEFTPVRLIMNIAVVEDVDGKPGAPVTSFDPPIELDVAYFTLELFEAVRTARPLKLAYWDDGEWVVFTPEDHQYALLSPIDGAIGKVKIRSWVGDPPVAWGT